MIPNDIIHVEAEGGKDSNVKNINTLETNDYMCAMRDVLNLLLLHISDHNQDKEHTNTTNGMDGPMVYVEMIED
jgi:hypothetical protein